MINRNKIFTIPLVFTFVLIAVRQELKSLVSWVVVQELELSIEMMSFVKFQTLINKHAKLGSMSTINNLFFNEELLDRE